MIIAIKNSFFLENCFHFKIRGIVQNYKYMSHENPKMFSHLKHSLFSFRAALTLPIHIQRIIKYGIRMNTQNA